MHGLCVCMDCAFKCVRLCNVPKKTSQKSLRMNNKLWWRSKGETCDTKKCLLYKSNRSSNIFGAHFVLRMQQHFAEIKIQMWPYRARIGSARGVRVCVAWTFDEFSISRAHQICSNWLHIFLLASDCLSFFVHLRFLAGYQQTIVLGELKKKNDSVFVFHWPHTIISDFISLGVIILHFLFSWSLSIHRFKRHKQANKTKCPPLLVVLIDDIGPSKYCIVKLLLHYTHTQTMFTNVFCCACNFILHFVAKDFVSKLTLMK